MGIQATAYLQVEPEWSYNGEHVTGAKVVRLTQRSPGANQRGGTVLVKITVDVPEGAFKPMEPEVVITIPEGMTIPMPIEVVASDPKDDIE